MGVQLCFIMMRLWLAVFLVGISCGLKYIEERNVTTSSGKTVNCFYTIQYNAKGVVSTKKSSVTCTPDKNGGFAMPVFDLPGVGPTSVKHSVKKGKDSVQDFSPHAGPSNAATPMNCSCRVPLSLDMMGSPVNKPNASQSMEGMEQMLEDMCSEGGKPEVLEELMEQMNITKDMVQQFMMASPDEKKEMIKNLMMSLPEEKKEFLKKIIQMIMGSGQMPPMGGGMKPPYGGGMKPPMGGGMKPPMGGGMKPPGGSDCQQQLMEMICSGKEAMQCNGGKPGSMQEIEAGVMQMMMDMASITITDKGEAAVNFNCDCTPMKQK